MAKNSQMTFSTNQSTQISLFTLKFSLQEQAQVTD